MYIAASPGGQTRTHGHWCARWHTCDLPQTHAFNRMVLSTSNTPALRVLYLATSPDGQTIVTGAGDETLRFWSVFPGPRAQVCVCVCVCDYRMCASVFRWRIAAARQWPAPLASTEVEPAVHRLLLTSHCHAAAHMVHAVMYHAPPPLQGPETTVSSLARTTIR